MVKVLKGVAAALVSFLLLGTVSALWENPIFFRMVPADETEIVLLGALSALLGVYVAVHRPSCSVGTAGTGGVLGFIGVACPICNKLLMLVFGADILLDYFEPIRIYVAVAGVLIMTAAVWTQVAKRRNGVQVVGDP